MFIHCMYVDILFPLTKAITLIFEPVTTHIQTPQTWTGYNAARYHNALPRFQYFITCATACVSTHLL